MRVLFDQGVPVPIKRYLTGHEVTLSVDAGWDRLRNGELLIAAEQNLKGRAVAIVVIGHSQWPALQEHVQRVLEAVNAAMPGSYVEVDIPLPPKKLFTRSS